MQNYKYGYHRYSAYDFIHCKFGFISWQKMKTHKIFTFVGNNFIIKR